MNFKYLFTIIFIIEGLTTQPEALNFTTENINSKNVTNNTSVETTDFTTENINSKNVTNNTSVETTATKSTETQFTTTKSSTSKSETTDKIKNPNENTQFQTETTENPNSRNSTNDSSVVGVKVDPIEYLFNKYKNLTYGDVSLLIKKLGIKPFKRNITIQNNETFKCYSQEEFSNYVSSKNGKFSANDFKELCPLLIMTIDSRVCREPKIKEKQKKTEKIKLNNNTLVWIFSFTAVILCSLVGLLVVWLIPIIPKSYYHCISQLLIALAVGSLTGDALLHLIPHALVDEGDGHSHGADDAHGKMVWKALVALVGIHIFFLTERITILCQNVHSKRKTRLKQLSQDFSDNQEGGDEANHNIHAPHKSPKMHWASKSRKYSGSYKGSDNYDVETIGVQLCNRPKTKPHVNTDCPDSMNLVLCQESTNNVNAKPLIPSPTDQINPSTDSLVHSNNQSPPNNLDSSISISMPTALCPLTTVSNGELPTNQFLAPNNNNDSSSLLTPVTAITPINDDTHQPIGTPQSQLMQNNWSNNEEDKLILDNNKPVGGGKHPTTVSGNNQNKSFSPQHGPNHGHSHGGGGHASNLQIGAGGATVQESLAHPFKNKPHGHHHGHSHDLSSVKAIAYTVIAGDGLHNFCDGIAIGAAFANDLRGGMSTAIAVLCHELPHELGDFVVLLHAGMSIRTAIFYNLLSSIFCAAGMVIGVLLGKVPSVSGWVFMLTAGMFLYIALVDMIPELSTRRLQGKKWVHRPSVLFIWQNIGIALGVCVMLVIALFEDRMF